MKLLRIRRDGGAEGHQQSVSKVQRVVLVLPETSRPTLTALHYSKDCRINLTMDQNKEEAAQAFNEWWKKLPSTDITVFSDGSEKYTEGVQTVIYGYAIYKDGVRIASESGALHK